MSGYNRTREVLAESAHLGAQGDIESFVRVGDEWAGVRAQDDDVTFAVLKVKG